MSDSTLVVLFRGSNVYHALGWPWPTACKAGTHHGRKVRTIDLELLDSSKVRPCQRPACVRALTKEDT